MTGVIARIVLRYLAAALVAKGILSPDIGSGLVADPDVMAAAQVAIGAVLGVGVELWYALAKRFGWST